MNSTILPGVALETDRLRLRCHRDGDLPNLIAPADNWRVARWLIHLAHPYSEANGREWIARVRQAHEGGRPREFAVALKDSDRLIGCVGIDGSNIGDSQGAAELGLARRAVLGKGLCAGSGSGNYNMKYGFDALGLETIHALCEPLNTASQKVLLACGLKRAGAECELKAPTRTGARRLPLFRASRMDTSPLQQ